MSLPRFIDIDGRRYLWRDLVALRQAQAEPRAEQQTLFELREEYCPQGERNAAERYCEPSLFTVMEPPSRGKRRNSDNGYVKCEQPAPRWHPGCRSPWEPCSP